MNTLKTAWLHFKKICKHKYYVAKYCFKAQLYWQGVAHDLSKLSPTEFSESVRFYNGIKSPIRLAKDTQGYSLAWFHHKGRNKHHYEYWVDNLDAGGVPVPMPYKYAMELICDYLGANHAYNESDFSLQNEKDWWDSNKDSMKMHDSTKEFVEYMINLMSETNSTIWLRRGLSKPEYDRIYKKYQ